LIEAFYNNINDCNLKFKYDNLLLKYVNSTDEIEKLNNNIKELKNKKLIIESDNQSDLIIYINIFINKIFSDKEFAKNLYMALQTFFGDITYDKYKELKDKCSTYLSQNKLLEENIILLKRNDTNQSLILKTKNVLSQYREELKVKLAEISELKRELTNQKITLDYYKEQMNFYESTIHGYEELNINFKILEGKYKDIVIENENLKKKQQLVIITN